MNEEPTVLKDDKDQPIEPPKLRYTVDEIARRWPDLGPFQEYEAMDDFAEFDAVDPDVPLLMMPVRLETRIDLSPAGNALRIRIYPDQLQVSTPDLALTPEEQAAGKRFWDQAAGAERPLQRAALKQLIETVGRRRAGHVAERSHPEYEGEKPEPYTGGLRRPELVCLPTRWIAVGYHLDSALFFKVGNKIERPLSTALAGTDAIGPDTPVDKNGAWMVDYQAALDKGMAIDVPLTQTIRAAGEITTLLVFGVSGELDRDAVSEEIGALLASHERSGGLGFMPQGLPTNNTKGEPTPWSRADDALDLLLDALLGKPNAIPGSALAETRTALGLGDIPALARAANAGDTDRALARAMNTVLYEAVIGRFVRRLVPPRAAPLDPAELADFRRWFIDHVTGGAPVATLRLGAQPFGLLPVAAFRPDTTGVPARTVAEHVERTVLALRDAWTRALDQVPLLDPNVVDRAAAKARPASAIPALLASQPHPARLFHRAYREKGDRLVGAYRTAVARIEDQDPDLFGRLRRLFAILPDAGDIDTELVLWASVHTLIDRVDPSEVPAGWARRAHGRINAILRLLGQIEQRQRPLKSLGFRAFRGLIGDPTDGPPTLSAYLEDRPANIATELADIALVTEAPGETGASLAAETLADLAAELRGEAPPRRSPDLLTALIRSGLGEATASERDEIGVALDKLATIDDPKRLDRLARETLGLGSHRLDAWYSSLAAREIDQARRRETSRTGLGLGAFGWVTDLKIGSTPRSTGFLHAPSPAQAATAAILRSGWLAHGGDDAIGPAAINANSARTRLAHAILDGVRNGQPLGTLLGYRFERSLRDEGLGGKIRDIREMVIDALGSDATADEPVDGERLLTVVRDPDLDSTLVSLNARLSGEVEKLEGLFDAVHDLALLEGTHAAATGRSAHASAVFDAVNQGNRLPPGFEAHRNPRSGTAVDHRVMLLFPPEGEVAPDTRGWSKGLRDQLMPGLERWLAALLPPAGEIGLTVAGKSLSLAELRLSALDALYLMGDDPTRVAPALHVRAVAAVTGEPARPEAHPATPVSPDHPVSLEEVQLIAGELRAALAEATPLGPAAFGPRGTTQPGPDAAADPGIAAALDALTTMFARAAADGDFDRLAQFGLARGDAAETMAAAEAILAQTAASTDAPQADRVRRLFGRDVPLAPGFTLETAPAVDFRDDLAKDRAWPWLDKLGAVRPGLGRLTTARALAQLVGAGALTAQVGQDGRDPNEGWIAETKPNSGGTGRLSIVACGGATPKPGDRVAGLMLDQWSERIPDTDQVTGVAFHYDAPSARPPQAMLLATAPPADEKATEPRRWRMRDVAQVLFDTLHFAALRMVEPEDLGDFGSVLPTIFAEIDPTLLKGKGNK